MSDNTPTSGPKFVGAYTLNPSEAWEGYREVLFKHHVKDMPAHMDHALNLAFLIGMAHGSMLQGGLANSCTEFVNDRINEMLNK